MRGTWTATRAVPLAEFGDDGRDRVEAELRAEAVALATGRGADLGDDVAWEVDVTWHRQNELWRDDDSSPLETRTVMVGTATVEADVDDDGAPGLVTLDPETADAVFGMGLDNLAGEGGPPCGSPDRRHSFLHMHAVGLRDGVLTEAFCESCRRWVTRDELLKNRQDEERGIKWWGQ